MDGERKNLLETGIGGRVPPRPGDPEEVTVKAQAARALDSLTASIISFVVALVLIPGTSNVDLGDFLNTTVKVSSPAV